MFLFFSFIASVLAQYQLNTIEVTAKPGPLLQHVSSPIFHAGEEALEENSQIQDVLNKAPGVMFTQAGGVGGVGSVYLRGSESRHTIFLVDGMRLNDPSNVTRNYDTAFFLTPFFQDLLLLRGPAPVLYGGDATGGVIEMVPRRGHSPKQNVLSLSLGSFETKQGFALFDWGQGSHQGTFGITHLKTAGISRLNKKRHGATERDGAEESQVMQSSHHQWSQKVSTDLMMYGSLGQADQDGTSVDEKSDRTKNELGAFSQITRTQFDYGHWWLRTGVVSQKRNSITQSLGSEIYKGETKQVQLGSQIRFSNYELISGAQFEEEWIGSRGTNKSNDLGSIFALNRFRQDKILFELGARGEHHQRYGGFLSYESTIKHQTNEYLSFHFKTAKGYKTPSLYQLYSPPSGGSPIGNTNLNPEENFSYEVGAEWKREGLISLVAFQQDFQSLIAFTNQGYQNRGTLRVKGVEASVVSPEHSWGQVSLSQTYLDFSNYSQSPLRRPPYLTTVSWNTYVGKWMTELSARLVGGRKDTTSTGASAHLVAYETLSGSLKYSPDQKQQWSLRLGNMTNREYEDMWGYSVSPLNATLQWLGKF
ncbi:MAG: TonB-dependent receptor [Bacteriovoracaceae bacterium]|nr:TonB-dependent receptor [Bacteriovoracaceae bacterium]